MYSKAYSKKHSKNCPGVLSLASIQTKCAQNGRSQKYVGCYLYYIIVSPKMVHLFFKVFASKIYERMQALTNRRSRFSTPSKRPKKYGFWTLQQRLLTTKIVVHAFFSWCTEIKRSQSKASAASARKFSIKFNIVW